MKKGKISLTFICFVLFTLIACKPSNISQEAYDTGIEAIKVMDGYINSEMKKDTCKRKLDSLYDDIKDIVNNSDDINYKDISVETYISTALTYVSIYGEGEFFDLKESRNKLAEVLGKKEIK